MPWTSPVDRASGYTVTNGDWNNNLGATGNTAYLYGDTAWTNVSAFTNSWVNFGAPYFSVGYRLVGNRVYLRGIMKSGTIGSAAFTLPSGYRPSSSVLMSTVSTNAFGVVQIAVAGTVIPTIGTNSSVSFDNLSFDIL
jgi:hypothetical protein